MASALDQRVHSPGLAPGTVKVSRHVETCQTRVWEALTDPHTVAQWFGTLLTPLAEGKSTRLDFGDGDFFLIEDVSLEPPSRLRYTWRFLGIGPSDTITWLISPAGEGTRVIVIDSEPERTREAAMLLRKGWLDFSKRLKDFLAKGRPTRYPWRHDFEGSIELNKQVESIWQRLFSAEGLPQWLPLGGSRLESGKPLVMTDDQEPAVLRVSNLVRNPPLELEFELDHPTWLHHTTCRLDLSPREHDTILNVSHTDWNKISVDKAYQKQQRKRFGEMWITTLKRARSLIDVER